MIDEKLLVSLSGEFVLDNPVSIVSETHVDGIGTVVLFRYDDELFVLLNGKKKTITRIV